MIKKNRKVVLGSITFCSSIFSKAWGLRLRRELKDEAYIFTFKKPQRVIMDMWLVFFSIDVVFLDERKKVLEIKENFLPFTFYSAKQKVSIIIEMPAGTVKKNGIKVSDLIEID